LAIAVDDSAATYVLVGNAPGRGVVELLEGK